MTGDRVAALRQMLEQRPDDARLRFGLALEYLNAGRTEEGVAELRVYLDQTDDEGNGWGRLGAALLELDQPDEARDAYRKGVEAANRHGHPTMADEFETVLDDLE